MCSEGGWSAVSLLAESLPLFILLLSASAAVRFTGGGGYFIVAPRGNEHLCEATNTSREATNTSVVAEENTLKAIYT